VNIPKFVFGLASLDELVTVGTFTPQAAAFLEAAKANLEGTGEITLRRLVTEALRMRPSRLVIGEVRQAERHGRPGNQGEVDSIAGYGADILGCEVVGAMVDDLRGHRRVVVGWAARPRQLRVR
jgi:hypothetical protein